jgi:hypothetical protein
MVNIYGNKSKNSVFSWFVIGGWGLRLGNEKRKDTGKKCYKSVVR